LRPSIRAEYAECVVDRESIEREVSFAELATLLEIPAKFFFSVH